jgi:hypothetical protein
MGFETVWWDPQREYHVSFLFRKEDLSNRRTGVPSSSTGVANAGMGWRLLCLRNIVVIPQRDRGPRLPVCPLVEMHGPFWAFQGTRSPPFTACPGAQVKFVVSLSPVCAALPRDVQGV